MVHCVSSLSIRRALEYDRIKVTQIKIVFEKTEAIVKIKSELNRGLLIVDNKFIIKSLRYKPVSCLEQSSVSNDFGIIQNTLHFC